MNNKRVRTKAMAMAVAAAMAVELCPVTAFAVTGDPGSSGWNVQ